MKTTPLDAIAYPEEATDVFTQTNRHQQAQAESIDGKFLRFRSGAGDPPALSSGAPGNGRTYYRRNSDGAVFLDRVTSQGRLLFADDFSVGHVKLAEWKNDANAAALPGFSGIAALGSFRALKIIGTLRCDANAQSYAGLRVVINGDSGQGSYRSLGSAQQYGAGVSNPAPTGETDAGNGGRIGEVNGPVTAANQFTHLEMTLMEPGNPGRVKTYDARTVTPLNDGVRRSSWAGSWAPGNPIDSLLLGMDGASRALAGSLVELYGLR